MAKETNRRGAMDVKAPPTEFKPGNRKTSTSTEDRRNYQYGSGGDDKNHRMFPRQTANQQKPGRTSHDTVAGDGRQLAEGGKTKTDFAGALPAPAGRTSQVKGGLEPIPGTVGQTPAFRDADRPGIGKTIVEKNVPFSHGSVQQYGKSDKSSDSDMPEWHRRSDRHDSRRGG